MTQQTREGGVNFSIRHRLIRIAWSIVWAILISWTPRNFGRWRRMILRAFGAKMASTSDARASVRIWYPPNLIMEERTIMSDHVRCYNMHTVRIRAGATVSQGVYLCGGTHDIDQAGLPLVTKSIEIGCESWIAADAFVGPGVTVGEGAVLGARGVTVKDLEPWTVYAGNPVRKIRMRKRPGPSNERVSPE